eukprot:1426993-Prymnesium_polylepis.2
MCVCVTGRPDGTRHADGAHVSGTRNRHGGATRGDRCVCVMHRVIPYRRAVEPDIPPDRAR